MDILYNITRHEKKLFISEAQYAHLLPLLEEHMQPDPYGCSVISSLYYARKKPLSVPGEIIMEIKTPAAIPLWLCSFLSEEGIYCTSFSKYGSWYKTEVLSGRIKQNSTTTRPCAGL